MEEENKNSLILQEREGTQVIKGSGIHEIINPMLSSQMGEPGLYPSVQFPHQKNEKEVNIKW